MRLPDGTILKHAQAPYDPVKAHEYYLRIRQLKGRKKGQPTFTVRGDSGRAVVLTAKQLSEQKAYADHRISQITARLAELESKLNAAMHEAQRKKATSSRKAKAPVTAAEKSKAARESKKYKASHRQELKTKGKRAAESKPTITKTKPTSKSDPVKELQGRINKVKGRLKAAIQIQKSLIGATRNR